MEILAQTLPVPRYEGSIVPTKGRSLCTSAVAGEFYWLPTVRLLKQSSRIGSPTTSRTNPQCSPGSSRFEQ
jgi:hypothetical protein